MDWEIFRGRDSEADGIYWKMLLYEAVIEGKKIDRLELDWEIEIFGGRFWDFFRLGGFWREGEKFFFSTKN